MTGDEFIRLCKSLVVKYFNDHKGTTDSQDLTADDVYIVWCCKTLQNNKALLSTAVPDNMYYEITYNGNKHEMYLDAYRKWENQVIPVRNLSKYYQEEVGSDGQ